MRRPAIAWLATVCLVWLTAGCGGRTPGPAEPDGGQRTLAQAAAEATAIIERAQATALVMQAQAAATAMVAQAGAAAINPASAAAGAANVAPITAAPGSNPTPFPTGEITTTGSIEVIWVGFAGEGGFIHVQFAAPPEVAENWWQGSVYVVDEASGAVYNEIPVMPKIGPLIGKPKLAGQAGYVMLVNAPPGLRPGAMVTVVLGDFKQEHIVVQ